MGMASEAFSIASGLRQRHPFAFWAGALVFALFALEGMLVLGSFLLPPEFCIAGEIGNCAGERSLQSQRAWEEASPVGIANITARGAEIRVTLVNNGGEPLKLERAWMQDTFEADLYYEFSAPVFLQPGSAYAADLGGARECPAGYRRFEAAVEYVSFGPVRQMQETGPRLFLKCQ